MTRRVHWRTRIMRGLRGIFSRQDSAPRIARGLAVGFFAAALPIPGLQIPLAMLLAGVFRGNLIASILPQFLSNALTAVGIIRVQYAVGAWFWPGASDQALAELLLTAGTWRWTLPGLSLRGLAQTIARLGAPALGPLLIGSLLTGLLSAIIAYPLTVMAIWPLRLRRPIRPRRPFVIPPAPPSDPAPSRALTLNRYVPRNAVFIRADAARLLIDGRQAFPNMLAAIDRAARSVDLETYILKADATGQAFADALLRAARRGVRVRLLFDWWGSMDLSGRYVKHLTAEGVRVAVYHPLVIWRPSWAINRRMHRKILVVDGQVGFTGGLNICDDQAPTEQGGSGWRDTHLRLDGAHAAESLLDLFEADWHDATAYAAADTVSGKLASGLRRPFRRPALVRQRRRHRDPVSVLCAPGGVAVQVLGNREFRFRRRIHRAHLYAIRRARRYILIENAYFIPNRDVRRALVKAARRGVHVAVVVAPAEQNDVPLAGYAGRNLFGELLAGGVRIFHWPQGMMHAKTVVIDDAWAIVGSYNFDRRSLHHQLEAVAVLADPDFARTLRDQTLADIRRCKELTLAQHEARSAKDLLIESSAFLLRNWL